MPQAKPITRKMTTAIEKARKRAGFRTQAELAEAAGLQRSNVTNILNGKKKDVYLSTLLKLSRACNCTVSQLIGEERLDE